MPLIITLGMVVIIIIFIKLKFYTKSQVVFTMETVSNGTTSTETFNAISTPTTYNPTPPPNTITNQFVDPDYVDPNYIE